MHFTNPPDRGPLRSLTLGKMQMIVVLARLNILPGSSEHFLQTAEQLVEASCKEAGVIGYELLTEGENRFAFLERYKDAGSAATHLKTDHYRTLGRELGRYIDGKPEVLKMTPTS
jgi:quinol monooxygenase YgiN